MRRSIIAFDPSALAQVGASSDYIREQDKLDNMSFTVPPTATNFLEKNPSGYLLSYLKKPLVSMTNQKGSLTKICNAQEHIHACLKNSSSDGIVEIQQVISFETDILSSNPTLATLFQQLQQQLTKSKLKDILTSPQDVSAYYFVLAAILFLSKVDWNNQNFMNKNDIAGIAESYPLIKAASDSLQALLAKGLVPAQIDPDTEEAVPVAEGGFGKVFKMKKKDGRHADRFALKLIKQG